LREQYSLDSMDPLLSERNASLNYQPYATTLVGAIEPCMTNRNLLHPTTPKRLSINVADDQLKRRIGSKTVLNAAFDELVRWCDAAVHTGWKMEVVNQGGGDFRFYKYLKKARPELAENIPFVSFHSHEEVFEYYKTVTVAASSRGHGMMILFGVQCATISLIMHEKVASFISDIGHPEWGVDMDPSRREARNSSGIADDLMRVLNYIDNNRALVHRQMLHAQANLMAVTANNMHRFDKDVEQRAKTLLAAPSSQ